MRKVSDLAWRARAAWARACSYLKKDWKFSDYPLRVNFHGSDVSPRSSQRRTIPWTASFVNWAMTGAGDTKDEAIKDLQQRFEEFKSAKKPLPRPGTLVPLQLADRTRVEQHSELATEFIQQVLDLPWAWISDESSLWDFHSDETNEQLVGRIRAVYGVDVSDISSGNLADIFDRIKGRKIQ